jgi:hypothetical protein
MGGKDFGMKSGSAEFHALKQGDFALSGERGGSSEMGQGNGKGTNKNYRK